MRANFPNHGKERERVQKRKNSPRERKWVSGCGFTTGSAHAAPQGAEQMAEVGNRDVIIRREREV